MANATIHITTKAVSTGTTLWQGVWCPACVAEHKQLFGNDKGVTIAERPWTGEARTCDSCDESGLAPELRAGAR